MNMEITYEKFALFENKYPFYPLGSVISMGKETKSIKVWLIQDSGSSLALVQWVQIDMCNSIALSLPNKYLDKKFSDIHLKVFIVYLSTFMLLPLNIIRHCLSFLTLKSKNDRNDTHRPTLL